MADDPAVEPRTDPRSEPPTGRMNDTPVHEREIPSEDDSPDGPVASRSDVTDCTQRGGAGRVRQYLTAGTVPETMVDRLTSARDSVQRASDMTDDATVREQLHSVDRGLMELTESSETAEGARDGVSTEADVPRGVDLEEIEEKLVDLIDATDGVAREHVQDARDAVDDYRQTYTRDW